ncbi:MAG: hypothetical protein H7641_04325 [Candidatus Heimdallarchaeota archaeon]|nr:hypothetical protein [Candidatus Heimdallarchaeota archaeon]MCK4876788.1 hypothetical protein [Candidatus Heimdallarchaeota archaeon]
MAAQQPYGFQVKQRIISFFRATYDIIDEATGNQVFVAKRKIWSFTPTLWIENMQGQEVARVKGNFLFGTNWKISQGTNLVGAVRFPLIKLCGIKFDVEISGNNYTASDILGWSFTARDYNGNVGFILDKKIFRIKDTYKVVVYPPLEPVLALAAALAIDSKFYQGNR